MALSRKAQKKKSEGGDGFDPDAWMLTFSDLLSLLLTFFVLLFSMKTLDNQVLKEMFTAFSGGAGPLSFTEFFPVEPLRRPQLVAPHTMSIKQFLDFLETEAAKTGQITSINVAGLVDALLLSEATIRKRGPNFVISFPNTNMFAPGSAELSPSARIALDRLTDAIQYSQSKIIIEGHTDDLPISTPRYPSNWELSAGRATAVMRYLVEGTGMKMDRILAAIGYADTQPIVGNISEAYRVRNRRVDIVIEQPAPEGA
jgi:chemotaxis protein MotB